MEEQVNRLVDKAWNLYSHLPPSQRLLIAIAGIPGSGKTTLASLTVQRLNARYAEQHPILTAGTAGLEGGSPAHPVAALVPMDGYHLTRAQLSALPDPSTAHARRGAAFTFDAKGYFELVKACRAPVTPEMGTIFAPTFDHAVKDPVEGGVEVGRGVRVVVFEGNYVALEDTPGTSEEGPGEAEEGEGSYWARAKAMMDEIWFVQVPFSTAHARLTKRHVAAGIEKDEANAARRAEENDLVNGKEIVDRKGRVDEVVQSLEDGGWAPKG